jgi:hypothetical protein
MTVVRPAVVLQSIGDPEAAGVVGAVVLLASVLLVVAWLLYLYR